MHRFYGRSAGRIWQFTNFRATLILLNFRSSSRIGRFWKKLKTKKIA